MTDQAIYHADKALCALSKRATKLSTEERESLAKALRAVQLYPEHILEGTIDITVSTRHDNEMNYASLEISGFGLTLSSGGSTYSSEVGSDSFSRTDFSHNIESEETEGDENFESWESIWFAHLPNSGVQIAESEVSISDDSEEVDENATINAFVAYTDQLPDLFAKLQDCVPADRFDWAGRIPKDTPGVYVFYQNDCPLYVGRSRDLRRRIKEHSHTSSTHNSASFAFLRARQKAEKMGHNLHGFSRKNLAEQHPIFIDLFSEEKLMVSCMDVRWVVVSEPVTQALLEVYAALTLGTPFNSFETS